MTGAIATGGSNTTKTSHHHQPTALNLMSNEPMSLESAGSDAYAGQPLKGARPGAKYHQLVDNAVAAGGLVRGQHQRGSIPSTANPGTGINMSNYASEFYHNYRQQQYHHHHLAPNGNDLMISWQANYADQTTANQQPNNANNHNSQSHQLLINQPDGSYQPLANQHRHSYHNPFVAYPDSSPPPPQPSVSNNKPSSSADQQIAAAMHNCANLAASHAPVHCEAPSAGQLSLGAQTKPPANHLHVGAFQHQMPLSVQHQYHQAARQRHHRQSAGGGGGANLESDCKFSFNPD